MALNLLYNTRVNGGLILIGNTIALTNGTDPNAPSTGDLLTPAGGTTRTWSQCGSRAILTLPSDSTVQYAWLFWYSTTKSSAGGDITASQDNAITFTTPTGANTLTPTATDNLVHDASTSTRYRGVDVTNLVSNAGAGTYTVQGVPTSVASTGAHFARCGWAMYVVYRKTLQAFRSISIYAGTRLVMGTTTGAIDITLSNFNTPTTTIPAIKGYFFATTADGDAKADATRVQAGANTSSLTNIGNTVNQPNANPGTVPNNPGNNFFGGQVNVADPNNARFGLLDTTGTLGTLNVDPYVPSQAAGVRTKWDITGIDISNLLSTNQTSLVVRTDGTTSGVYVELTSQAIMVDLNSPRFSNFVCSVDKQNLDIGDTLTFSMGFSNTGTLAADNLVFQNTIPNGLSFVNGSVQYNGVTQPSDNPQTGISVGTVAINQSASITFKAIVITIPSTNPFKNTSAIGFNFVASAGLVIPNNVEVTSSPIRVNHVDASLSKSIGNYAAVGEILNYTIPITLTGSTTVTTAVLLDTLPDHFTFITDSLKLDGTTITGATPNPGFTFNNLSIGTHTVAFKVNVNKIPTINPISSGSNLSYTYTVDPSIPKTFTGYKNSNSVSVKVNQAYLNLSNSSSKNYVTLDDEITYTIAINNVGNTSVNNVVVLNTLPSALSFISNSIVVNGVVKTGLSANSSFNIGTLPVGYNTVTFKAKVITIPNPKAMQTAANVAYSFIVDEVVPRSISSNINSNTANVVVNYSRLAISKSVDKATAKVGDEIIHTIQCKNIGNIAANNVIIKTDSEAGIALVDNSITVNNISTPGTLDNINIGSVNAGDTVTITFKVRIEY